MTTNPDQYCRDIETYLCRKNGGHLIRIVGPSFDRVRGWAAEGVPLKIVYRGIDKHFERYEARDRGNRRRRPIRIDLCEDDVLGLFDEWRRALGVGILREPLDTAASEDGERRAPRSSLPNHLDRVTARLTLLRTSLLPPSDQAVLDELVREVDALRAGAASVRGEKRDAALSSLTALDARLDEWVRGRCGPDQLARAYEGAREELAPFRERMPQDAYARSLDASVLRHLREELAVPRLSFE